MNQFGMQDHLSKIIGIKNTAVTAIDSYSFGLEYLRLVIGSVCIHFCSSADKKRNVFFSNSYLYSPRQFSIGGVNQPGPSIAIMQSVSTQMRRSGPIVIIPWYRSKRAQFVTQAATIHGTDPLEYESVASPLFLKDVCTCRVSSSKMLTQWRSY